MSREEEKINAANEYIHKRIYEEGCGRTGDTFPAFIEGIEWSDEHPRKGLVDIDKVCKWFEENLHMYNTSECRGDRIAFVEDFKKAMEE